MTRQERDERLRLKEKCLTPAMTVKEFIRLGRLNDQKREERHGKNSQCFR